MAKLEIEVKHSGGGGSGSAAGRGAFTAQDAEQIKRSLEQANRLSVVLLKGAKDFRAEFGAAAKGLDTGLAAVASNADKNASRMALGFQRSLEQAAKAGGTAFERETSRGISKGIAGGLGGASRIGVTAFSRYGVEASSAFGVAFQGGLNGNLIRGAGGLGGATARLGGEIGRSLATAAGAGFKLLPVLGPALSGVSTIIGAAFSVAGSLAGTLTNAAGEIAGRFGDALGTALKVAVGTAAVVGISGLRLALKESDLAPSFERIAKASGDSVPKSLEKLRAATRGTVSDLDLMRLANQSVALGAAQTIPNIERLAGVSVSLARIVGRDATDAFNRLVLGIGKAEPELLDELAIKIRLTDVTKAYGESIGKAAQDLTAAERTQAVLNATLAEAERVIASGGKATLTSGELYKRFTVSVENASKAIGKALLPALDAITGPLTQVTDAVGRFVARAANINGDGFKAFASSVEANAQKIADVFDGLDFDAFTQLGKNAFESIGLFARDIFDDLGTYAGLRLEQALLQAVASVGKVSNRFLGVGGLLLNGAQEDTQAAADSLGQSASRLTIGGPRPNRRQAELSAQNGSIIADAQLRGAIGRNGSGSGSGFDGAAGLFGINAALAQSAGLGGSRSAAPAASRPSGGVPVVPVSLPDPPAFSRSGSFGGPTQTPFGLGGLSPLAALTDAVGPNLASQIEPTLKALAEAIAGAADPAKELREAVDLLRGADIAQTAADFGDAITAPMERSIENFEDNLREVSRLGEREQDAIEKASEAMRKLGDDLADGLDDIADAFNQDRDQVLARRDQRVAAANQRTAGLKDQLIGQAGGIGPDESAIPAKLRRAAKKARKNANKERRDSLRNLSDGLSTDELAANGASLLQNVFEEQAAKETNRTGEIQAAYAAAAQAIRELENDRIAAELALKATIEEEAAKELELIKKSVEILEALTKSKEADTRTLEELRARLAVVEASNKKVEDLARRAAR
jgi:hypothetical protein